MTLDAYNNEPLSAIGAINTATYFADQGKHDLSLLMCEEAIKLDDANSLHLKLLERYSISGFYSKIDSRKLKGKSACEELALDRKNSWHIKHIARQNSTFYARSATDIMPNTFINEFDFTPPHDYKPMNPSITSFNNELWMIQRTVNYLIREDGSYDMRGDTAIRTVNYLMKLDNDMKIIESYEILPPLGLPEPKYNLVIGWEDCRLFFWKGEPWATSTARELNSDGYCEIVISKIINDTDPTKKRFTEYRVITPTFCDRQHQKNWMPMVVGDDLFFLYSSDPTIIIDHNGNLVSHRIAHIAADSFRGGGPLVEFGGGWLALIHESHGMPDHRRRYMHRWVWYDAYGRLSRYSEAFYIKQLGIEFAAGLAKHVSGDIIVSFGLHDKSSWFARFKSNEIKKILKPAGIPLQLLPNDTESMVFLTSEINKPLDSQLTVDKCKQIANRSALPLHSDNAKNWDNLVAIWHTTLTTDKTDPVMDVAATEQSAYLPSLYKLGYNNLVSINLTQTTTEVIDGVSYQPGDCTATTFANDHFGFISCLSVVEHGVDLKKFFNESARILKPNGHLFVSTDYWIDTVDTKGQMAFGSPIKVFTADDIAEMIEIARDSGLILTGNAQFNCKDKVVNWMGMDYTFINLLFKKI